MSCAGVGAGAAAKRNPKQINKAGNCPVLLRGSLPALLDMNTGLFFIIDACVENRTRANNSQNNPLRVHKLISDVSNIYLF